MNSNEAAELEYLSWFEMDRADQFTFATTEDLALMFGAPADEAKAIHAQVERLAGATLTLVMLPASPSLNIP